MRTKGKIIFFVCLFVIIIFIIMKGNFSGPYYGSLLKNKNKSSLKSSRISTFQNDSDNLNSEIPPKDEITKKRKEIFEDYSPEEVKLISLAIREKWDSKVVKEFIKRTHGVKDRNELKKTAKEVAREDFAVRMGLLKWIRLNYGSDEKKKDPKESKKKKLGEIILRNQKLKNN